MTLKHFLMFSYLCVCVYQVYGRIYRVVEPKRARLHGAMTQLAEKQASLAEAQGKLREVSMCQSVLHYICACMWA